MSNWPIGTSHFGKRWPVTTEPLLEIAERLVESETVREELGDGVLPDVIEAQVQALRIRELQALNDSVLAASNEQLANLLGLQRPIGSESAGRDGHAIPRS